MCIENMSKAQFTFLSSQHSLDHLICSILETTHLQGGAHQCEPKNHADECLHIDHDTCHEENSRQLRQEPWLCLGDQAPLPAEYQLSWAPETKLSFPDEELEKRCPDRRNDICKGLRWEEAESIRGPAQRLVWWYTETKGGQWYKRKPWHICDS